MQAARAHPSEEHDSNRAVGGGSCGNERDGFMPAAIEKMGYMHKKSVVRHCKSATALLIIGICFVCIQQTKHSSRSIRIPSDKQDALQRPLAALAPGQTCAGGVERYGHERLKLARNQRVVECQFAFFDSVGRREGASTVGRSVAQASKLKTLVERASGASSRRMARRDAGIDQTCIWRRFRSAKVMISNEELNCRLRDGQKRERRRVKSSYHVKQQRCWLCGALMIDKLLIMKKMGWSRGTRPVLGLLLRGWAAERLGRTRQSVR